MRSAKDRKWAQPVVWYVYQTNQPGGEPIKSHYTLEALIVLTKALPIGTNKALLHFLWMLISGALLAHRGALFPALQSIGLQAPAVRRAWRAFRKGVWQIAVLIQWWREYVLALPEWEVHEYEGYRPVAIDITAFWRPQLQDCPSQHYHPTARRALPADGGRGGSGEPPRATFSLAPPLPTRATTDSG